MKIRKSTGERVFDSFNVIILFLFCLTILYPFVQQIMLSISPPSEARLIGLHLYVKNPTLDAYKRIFFSGVIFEAYYWTILRTIIGTILTVLVSAMISYPLSKRYLWGRKLWMWLVVFTMFFSGGLVPTYLLVRSLHLTNTIWSLVLPGMLSAFNIIIIRNYFSSLPEELEESARMDGANDIFIFFRIIMPLSTPVIATITLWTMVWHWNSWFDAMIYITNDKIKVLQVVLRQTLNDASQMSGMNELLALNEIEMAGQLYTPESVKSAILIVVVLPILCVYPFLQKYFVKGIMIGAVKG
ncbi:MAG: lplC6 [Paenibacillaceae bacterium]|jgi:putative aldouronate transport system permease protein|nr:lplC6 [Paenibacillaceae bacterium]